MLFGFGTYLGAYLGVVVSAAERWLLGSLWKLKAGEDTSKWYSFSCAIQVDRFYQVVSCRFKRSVSQGRSNNEKGFSKALT